MLLNEEIVPKGADVTVTSTLLTVLLITGRIDNLMGWGNRGRVLPLATLGDWCPNRNELKRCVIPCEIICSYLIF